MTTIRTTAPHTAFIWRDVYAKLQNARERARAGKLAAFEETNRQLFNEAEAHMQALTWKDGEELNVAMQSAGAWLADVCK